MKIEVKTAQDPDIVTQFAQYLASRSDREDIIEKLVQALRTPPQQPETKHSLGSIFGIPPQRRVYEKTYEQQVADILSEFKSVQATYAASYADEYEKLSQEYEANLAILGQKYEGHFKALKQSYSEKLDALDYKFGRI